MSSATTTRRPVRAVSRNGKACLTCRQRRVRCDERKPECSRCKNSGFRCVQPPDPQGDEHLKSPHLSGRTGLDTVAVAPDDISRTAQTQCSALSDPPEPASNTASRLDPTDVIDDSVHIRDAGVIGGLHDVILSVFADVLQKTSNIIPTATISQQPSRGSARKPLSQDLGRDRKSEFEQSGPMIEAYPISTSPHVRVRRNIPVTSKLAEIFSRLVLWGDAIYSGKAEATSVQAPWLFHTMVELLADCGRDLTILAAPLSRDTSESSTEVVEINSLKVWLEKANCVLDPDLNEPSLFSAALTDTYELRNSDDLAQLLGSLDNAVGLLMDLLPSIEHVSVIDEPSGHSSSRLGQDLKVSQPAWKWIDQVASKYGEAPQCIVERLGEANWQRFCRLRITQDSSRAQELGQAQSVFRAPLTTHAAEMLAKSTGHTKSFIDSAYGTLIDTHNDDNESVRSHSSFASTVNEDAHHFSRVPPEPLGVTTGTPFICGICGEEVKDVRNRIRWKLHVYRDLRPYICLDDACTDKFTTFASRGTFADHNLKHIQKAVHHCRDCDLFQLSELQMNDHVAQKHEGLSTTQKLTFLAASKYLQPPEPASLVCNLCKVSEFSTLRKYTSHVCRHMEDIALSTLPRELYGDDDKSDSTGSDLQDLPGDEVEHERFSASQSGLTLNRAESGDMDTGGLQLTSRDGLSCEMCRRLHKVCLPKSRDWRNKERCERCKRLGYDCGPPETRTETVRDKESLQASTLTASIETPVNEPDDSHIPSKEILDQTLFEEVYTIKCICGYDDDDGNTAYCEKCDTWQHIECFYYQRAVPEIHACIDCAPKETITDISPEKARERQRRAREPLDRGGDRRVKKPTSQTRKKKQPDPLETNRLANGWTNQDSLSNTLDEPPPVKKPTHKTQKKGSPMVALPAEILKRTSEHSRSGATDEDPSKSEAQNPQTRCKVYDLRNNDWFDRGTGNCTFRSLNDDTYIFVRSEDDPDKILLDALIRNDIVYQTTHDTLIEWWDPVSDTDMALSFQDATGCGAVFDRLEEAKRLLLQDGVIHDSAHDFAGITSAFDFD